MRILIADDEPIAREILREHLESFSGVTLVGEASTGTEAVDKTLALQPDLLLLDLEMPQLDGLGVVRRLRPDLQPLVVFVTAYQQHALSAFEVGAVDYLLKPVRRERLEQALEKARKQIPGAGTLKPRAEAPPRKIVGRRGNDIYLLDPDRVIAFRAEGDLVKIITGTDTYLAEHSLKELQQKLDTQRFRRIHRSTIINTDHIRKISPLSSKRWMLKLSNGMEAVVSKRMASSIREPAEW